MSQELKAQAEQRGEVVPVATAHIDRQRLDGSWDMVARFPAPADPSSPDGLPRGGIKVYTAPPAPAVPDAWLRDAIDALKFARDHWQGAARKRFDALIAAAPEVKP